MVKDGERKLRGGGGDAVNDVDDDGDGDGEAFVNFQKRRKARAGARGNIKIIINRKVTE